ncbi:hypothetical protein ACU8DI_15215 [Psychroserpens sp. BH13MA-6]
MNFFKNLFKKKSHLDNEEDDGNYIVITLNDKCMPLDRGEIYGNPLDEFIQSSQIGELVGGGTMQLETGEIEYCDLEVLLDLDEVNDNHIKSIINKLEELGAPKGSKLRIEKTEQIIEFGKKEGLAIYIDGVNLDKEVYEKCDSNFVVSEIKKLINDNSDIVRFWQGNTETGIYFYSDSFEKMNESITEFVNEYPLCKNARIKKIA